MYTVKIAMVDGGSDYNDYDSRGAAMTEARRVCGYPHVAVAEVIDADTGVSLATYTNNEVDQ